MYWKSRTFLLTKIQCTGNPEHKKSLYGEWGYPSKKAKCKMLAFDIELKTTVFFSQNFLEK